MEPAYNMLEYCHANTVLNVCAVKRVNNSSGKCLWRSDKNWRLFRFPGKVQEVVGFSMLLVHMLPETQCWLCPGHMKLSSATICQLWKLTVFFTGKLHTSITSESGGISRTLMKQLLVEDKSGNCVIR